MASYEIKLRPWQSLNNFNPFNEKMKIAGHCAERNVSPIGELSGMRKMSAKVLINLS